MKEFLKAVNLLAMKCVVKVLKVDLNVGNYRIIYIDKGEHKSKSKKLDDWIEENCLKELIHPDYSEAFKNIFRFENMKNSLKHRKYLHFKYKRASDIDYNYRTSVMTALPVEGNKCYLIIYDIEDC